MAGALKRSTGLTGLAVSANPHHQLGTIYSKILRVLTKIPESAAYRKYTEQVVMERASILKATSSTADIEKQIGCGQVEELIVQAKNELNLARKMLEWKPWEPLEVLPPKNQWDWPPTN